jgi:hypothetical protein
MLCIIVETPGSSVEEMGPITISGPPPENMATDGTFTLFLLPRNRGQSRLFLCFRAGAL